MEVKATETKVKDKWNRGVLTKRDVHVSFSPTALFLNNYSQLGTDQL